MKTISEQPLADCPTRKNAPVLPVDGLLPDDLRAWLSPRALLQLAQSAAQENSGDNLRPVFAFSSRRFHHPGRMLTLVLYAYGSGVWDTRDLAALAAQDPYLLELCRGEAPSGDMLRRFRNQNRAVVMQSLEKMIRLVWCHRRGQRSSAVPPLLIVEILSDARSRLQRSIRCDGTTESLSFAD